MSQEIELKFAIQDNNIPALQQYLDHWVQADRNEFDITSAKMPLSQFLDLENTYYDTPEHILRINGFGLRTRSCKTDNHVQYEMTLKGSGKVLAGLHERTEFNILLDNNQPDLTYLLPNTLPNFIDVNLINKSLIPLFTTQFLRQVWLISFAQSEIEVVLDKGTIESNGRCQKLQEIELELKQGNIGDLLNLAVELSCFQLHLFSQSKAARGYQLLKNRQTQPLELQQIKEVNLTNLIVFWQQNEEYALENQDFIHYQNTLIEIEKLLITMLPVNSPELSEWQQSRSKITSITDFAFSSINNKLKLMIMIQLYAL